MSGFSVRDDRERIAFNPAHLDDYNLDPYEFRVYMRFARRAGTKSTAYESVAKVADACNMSERKVRYVLKCLVEYRLIGFVEQGFDTPNEYAMLPYSKWKDPGHIPATRQRVLKADPDKKPQHKKPAPLAGAASGAGGAARNAGGAARNAGGAARNAGGGLHEMQAKVTPTEGSPFKVTPFKGSVDTDIVQTETKKHPKRETPPEYEDLYGVWNTHRGSLPEAVNDKNVNKALKTMLSGDEPYDRGDLIVLIGQAAQEVSRDTNWLEKRYGLVNLLRHLDSKAATWRSRQETPHTDTKTQKVHERRERFRNVNLGAD